jgi:hypothetical protein
MVTLTTDCSNSASNVGCYMAYEETGANAVTATNATAVGSQRVDSSPFIGSASYLVTLTNAGTTTFTAEYAVQGGAGTATFTTGSILVQVP